MKTVAALLVCLLLGLPAQAQKPLRIKFTDPGVFGVGIRTAAGLSISDSALRVSEGGGVQARLMVLQRLNTEWYAEWLRGGFSDAAYRTDVHLGLNTLLYFQRRLQRVAPFVLTGIAADALTLHNRLTARHRTSSWTTALQGGIGFHINLTWRSDLTVSAAYQHHLSHQAILQTEESILAQVPRSGRTGDGHLLVTLSMNYKITDLWKTLKFR
ncbi:MAG: hypothetical protein RMK52_06455 [Chitinophagales bacterium]|nr:hypothetical protein [Chitinophagales bacterium]MDW8393868.1 hypothetical protein [Chitinophagales bacterium]